MATTTPPCEGEMNGCVRSVLEMSLYYVARFERVVPWVWRADPPLRWRQHVEWFILGIRHGLVGWHNPPPARIYWTVFEGKWPSFDHHEFDQRSYVVCGRDRTTGGTRVKSSGEKLEKKTRAENSGEKLVQETHVETQVRSLGINQARSFKQDPVEVVQVELEWGHQAGNSGEVVQANWVRSFRRTAKVIERPRWSCLGESGEAVGQPRWSHLGELGEVMWRLEWGHSTESGEVMWWPGWGRVVTRVKLFWWTSLGGHANGQPGKGALCIPEWRIMWMGNLGRARCAQWNGGNSEVLRLWMKVWLVQRCLCVVTWLRGGTPKLRKQHDRATRWMNGWWVVRQLWGGIDKLGNRVCRIWKFG